MWAKAGDPRFDKREASQLVRVYRSTAWRPAVGHCRGFDPGWRAASGACSQPYVGKLPPRDEKAGIVVRRTRRVGGWVDAIRD